ncbi:aminoglycoside phosphotransferase family protein [Alicyclobacillus dauci]|uniref:Aminoglycoside phosphotransferase family protein n=1 Tax=Alicyclobacillus dauci TaxID=1475485 RepID=A0ABY6Z199_9BACL|nr:aminoglycoside phosphotransferase family protein [Alicyclobacillus dauci]WAH35750.1 aminoglycoside phosphotransferase family protein [Alicyclobacillus dauci]
MHEMTEHDVVALIKAEYNLDVTDVSWHDSLYTSHVAARVKTRQGTFKLKRYSNRFLTLKQLYGRYQTLSSLRILGVPKWHLTTDGAPSTLYRSKAYYLVDWVEGRSFQHSYDDAMALGLLLREVHVGTRSKEFQIPTLQHRLRPIMNAKEILRRHRYRNLPVQVDRFLQRESSFLQATMTRSVRTLTSLAGELEPKIVHGDVTIPNVLYQGKKAILIDWERVSLGYAMEELAKTAMNTCNLSTGLADHLLQGYGWDAISEPMQTAFRAFLQIPREVIYLLHLSVRKPAGDAERAQWQLIMQTWRDRKAFFAHYEV